MTVLDGDGSGEPLPAFDAAKPRVAPARKETALERTKRTTADADAGRKNQARAFYKRVDRSRRRHKLEKAQKKKNRRR